MWYVQVELCTKKYVKGIPRKYVWGMSKWICPNEYIQVVYPRGYAKVVCMMVCSGMTYVIYPREYVNVFMSKWSYVQRSMSMEFQGSMSGLCPSGYVLGNISR